MYMVKLLVVSNYEEGTGWSQASIGNILAAHSVGIDVVCRPLTITGNKVDIPPIIKELEKKDLRGVTHCIQHTLPSLYEYKGGIKNIGLYATESDSFVESGWPHRINMMDEGWVICKEQVEASKKSGVKVPIKVLPHAFDTTKYQKNYDKLKLPILKDTFIFYTIAEFSRRKNLAALLKAFHGEFSNPNDPVILLIKTSVPGENSKSAGKILGDFCNSIKGGLKLYNSLDYYRPEIIVTDRLSEEEMCRLHVTCDAFVCPSYNEAWCAVKGTLVDLYDNSVCISEVREGNLILTHSGKLQKVTKTLDRTYEGDIISIKAKYLSVPLEFTPEHPHYIVKRNNKRLNKNISLQPEFVEAKDVKKGDFWVVPKIKKVGKILEEIKISDYIDVDVDSDGYIKCPNSYSKEEERETLTSIAEKFNCKFQLVSKVINNKCNPTKKTKEIFAYIKENNIKPLENLKIPNDIKLTKEFMFFLGHYLAEGSVSCGTGVLLTTHKDEKYGRNLSSVGILEAFNLKAKEYQRKNKPNCTLLRFYNKIIAQLIKILCGEDCNTKYIHPDLHYSPNIGSLIGGMFYGDGSWNKKEVYKIYTNSRTLSRQIVKICNMNNVFVSYHQNRNNVLAIVKSHNDRFEDFANPYKYNEKCHIDSKSRYLFLEDSDNFYIPITSIKIKKYQGTVYNLSVENDMSYTCNGYATHNCIPAADALGFGKAVIANKVGGLVDFIDDSCGWLVDNREEPYFAQTDNLPNLYTANETCKAIDILGLRKAMREVFENHKLRKEKGEKAMDRIYNFSYEKVGNIMRKHLED